MNTVTFGWAPFPRTLASANPNNRSDGECRINTESTNNTGKANTQVAKILVRVVVLDPNLLSWSRESWVKPWSGYLEGDNRLLMKEFRSIYSACARSRLPLGAKMVKERVDWSYLLIWDFERFWSFRFGAETTCLQCDASAERECVHWAEPMTR